MATFGANLAARPQSQRQLLDQLKGRSLCAGARSIMIGAAWRAQTAPAAGKRANDNTFRRRRRRIDFPPPLFIVAVRRLFACRQVRRASRVWPLPPPPAPPQRLLFGQTLRKEKLLLLQTICIASSRTRRAAAKRPAGRDKLAACNCMLMRH